MTMQLQIQAEPFEAYSEASAQLQSEGRFSSRRGGSPSSYGRHRSPGSFPGRGRIRSTRAFPPVRTPSVGRPA